MKDAGFIKREVYLNKESLRKKMLQGLKNQKEVTRLKKSLGIMRKLFALSEYRSAKTVMFYASFCGEVDTYRMIKESIKKGKVVALPVIAKDKKKLTPRVIKGLAGMLQTGALNAPAPKPGCSRRIALSKLDLVVVPGLAFDRCGNRLGRGGGFYDRFLAHLPKASFTTGICFAFQIVSSLCHSSKDLAVKKVISA